MQGYLTYLVDSNVRQGQPPRQNLAITDMAWLTASAYTAIWTYLSQFDLVDRISRWKVPPDDPLVHLLLEPKQLEVTAPSSGLLARLVDVEKALPQRRYDTEGTLTFEIVDELCDWNNGTWQLEAAPCGGSVSRAKATPQLTMPVSTLAMLFFGRITASQAAAMGRLDVQDADSLKKWDNIMRTEHVPYCADNF